MFDVVFSSGQKLQQLLGTTKDMTQKHEKSGMYKVTCKQCVKVYIGQSRRQVLDRFKEHIRCIKNNQPKKSAVAFHAIEKLHLNIKNYTVDLIKPLSDNFKLDAWESWFIYKYKANSDLMNIEPSPIFSPLFNLI